MTDFGTEKKSSLSNDNIEGDNKVTGNVNETLKIDCFNKNFCYDIKGETKKYLERVFKNENNIKRVIKNENNMKNNKNEREIAFFNNIELKYNNIYECWSKSIDFTNESIEKFMILNDLFCIKETICRHTKVKKFIIGGYKNTSYNDKNILIFGIKNSNISILINKIFYYLYQWIRNEEINYFFNQIYTLNRSKELCIYEFNNTILPYKIRLIDCPEYNINQNCGGQFNTKKLYKNFFRKYVNSKGYLVLSSVIIAAPKENHLLDNNFQKQIKKLKYIFGEGSDHYIFEKCINGKLKSNSDKNNPNIYNNISGYFKKLEDNYKILLKFP
uniref:Decapping nuclease n=1 Tax=Strongyloides stercoralis TaxID=6248 RepID=A0A0K0E1M6_STRER